MHEKSMSEKEKLEAGLDFCFDDPEVVAIKQQALAKCQVYNAIDVTDTEAQTRAIKDLLGSTGDVISVMPVFNCDNGKNIHVGENFLANYNVTILDIAPVTFGDHCMVGPNTLISTVGHPLTPAGRRAHTSLQAPVTIGNDVWIGGNVSIMPGVTIGNNVVVAAGAVVTKDVPSNSLVAGVPARVIREVEDDL